MKAERPFDVSFVLASTLLVMSFLCASSGCDLPKPRPKPVAKFEGGGNFAFSPDGKYFYAENKVRDTSDWKVAAEFQYDQYVRDIWVQFSSDSKRMVLLNLGVADIYEVPSFKRLQRVNVRGSVAACLTPDQKLLATCSSDRKVQLWELKDYDPEAAPDEVPTPLKTVNTSVDTEAFTISNDGSLLAVAEDKLLKVYNTSDLSEVASIKPSFNERVSTVNRLCILPDNRRVVLLTGREVTCHFASGEEPVLKLETFPKYFDTAVAWSEQQRAFVITFVSYSTGKFYVQFFDDQSGQSRGVMKVHEHHGQVGKMHCSPDGKWLVTNGAPGGLDKMEFKVWNTEELVQKLLKEVPEPKKEDPSGKMIAWHSAHFSSANFLSVLTEN